jgi:succinate dehydrogenase hydrophobic anchor subunit
MQIYFLYIKNLVDNLLDNFFCNFFDIDIFENFSENKIYLTELSDIFKYFFNFQFEEFLFFFSNFVLRYKKKYSIFFYFFSLLLDIYALIVSYLISHLWLSTKIYNDYVHNHYRRKFLKILSIFLLIFSLIFLIFYFFII